MTSRTRELGGYPTTVVVQPFADRVLVLVTQLGKIGNLIQASLPSTTPLNPASSPDVLPTPPAALQLTTLLGSAPSEHMRTMHSLYASQIATIVWLHEAGAGTGSRRSVVVGLAFQPFKEAEGMEITDSQRKAFYSIMEMIQQLLHQAL
ncbi:hypothetical protein AX15_005188 [Amanita polypyramis BW_CC]|nr:hypothetical protein AX15_005188 [Amanita polypyramis BW_CC]